MRRLSVVVIDAHRVVAELLTVALTRDPEFTCAGWEATGAQGLRRALQVRPDVVVVDADLPDTAGADVVRALRTALPGTRCVVLSAAEDARHLAEAVDAGACGFLRKDVTLAVLLGTLRAARQGTLMIDPTLVTHLLPRPRRAAPDAAKGLLTEREREVLQHLRRGRDVRAIAREMGISLHTCRGYIKAVLLKLDAHTQLEAVVVASDLGLLSLSDSA